ncbi:MAG: hypothetical protein HQL79_11805 [Magnetococcales bacterium]|nr:hypothetical protein [Magnetococcales bacterium]
MNTSPQSIPEKLKTIGQSIMEEGCHFLLFTVGDGINSQRALENLNTLCNNCQNLRQVRVYDVIEDYDIALAFRVVVTPFLVRIQPGKPVEMIGDLSNLDQVQQSLNFPKGLCNDRNKAAKQRPT